MKNLWGRGEQKKTTLYVYSEKKLRMFFPNIKSHILGLIMYVEITSKHQKILTKVKCADKSEQVLTKVNASAQKRNISVQKQNVSVRNTTSLFRNTTSL